MSSTISAVCGDIWRALASEKECRKTLSINEIRVNGAVLNSVIDV